MNFLRKPEAMVVLRDFDQRLTELLQFGQPRLGFYGSGWHCCVEMNISIVGGKFEVRSDFSHKTPEGALAECEQRVAETLRQMRVVTSTAMSQP